MKEPRHFPLYKYALQEGQDCADTIGNIPATPRAPARKSYALRTRAGAFLGGGLR
jgi:hypothetical protein